MTMLLNNENNPVIILAPMAGVSDFPFRQIVKKYSQPTLLISEMIASQSMIRSVEKSLEKQCQTNESIAVQLAGNDPSVMADAARMSVNCGAKIIDINMGCPVKKIAVNSYAGSALMKDELLVAQIFSAIKKAVSVPVTVKMRKGWDDKNQNAAHLCHIAKNEGLSYVTVHGRTRTQMFTGQADWSFIDNLHKTITMPIIGNGDIKNEIDAQIALSKASGIMVGRGMYGKPWLIDHMRHFVQTGQKKPDPCPALIKNIVQEHMDLVFSYYGSERGVGIARKHLAWYSKGIENAAEFRGRVFASETSNEIFDHVHHFF